MSGKRRLTQIQARKVEPEEGQALEEQQEHEMTPVMTTEDVDPLSSKQDSIQAEEIGHALRMRKSRSFAESFGFKHGPRIKIRPTIKPDDSDWTKIFLQRRSGQSGMIDSGLDTRFKEESGFTFDYAMQTLAPYAEADLYRTHMLQRVAHPDSKIPILMMWQSSAWQFMFDDFFFWTTIFAFWASVAIKMCMLELDIGASWNEGKWQLYPESQQLAPDVKEQWALPLFPPYLMTALSFLFFSFFSHFASKQDQKFETNFNQCCTAQGRCFNAAQLMQGSMSDSVLKIRGIESNDEKEHARHLAARILRFMQVGFLQGIVGLTPMVFEDPPTNCCENMCHMLEVCCGPVWKKHGAYDSSWLIAICIKHNLLETLELRDFVERFDLDAGGTPYRHLMAQCHMLLMQMEHKNYIDKRTFELVSIEINTLRGAMGTLSDIQALSNIPLFVNGLVTFTILFITMNAVDLGLTYTPSFDTTLAPDMNPDGMSRGADGIAIARLFFAFFGLVFFCLGIFGQLTAAFHMADPFGNEESDLFITSYLEDTILGSKRLFNWDCHMTLHEQMTTDENGNTHLRQVAPLVSLAHDDVRGDELLDTSNRNVRRCKLPRPMLHTDYPEHGVLLDFDEHSEAKISLLSKSNAHKHNFQNQMRTSTMQSPIEKLDQAHSMAA